jgi:Tfp pilus assembly protein PilO
VIAGLAPRERRIVVVGVAVVLLVVGWEFVVQPIREGQRLAAELTPVREQLLVRRQELVARTPAVVAELEAVDERLQALSGRLLTGGTPAVAAADLQKLAKDLAAEASTEIRSERILPPVERGELLEIPIEIAVSGEIRHLVALLSRLEQTPKLLTVQDFRVRVVNIAQPRELLATLTLSGFILAGKARS